MRASKQFLEVKDSSHPITNLLNDPKWRKVYNTNFRNAKRRGIGWFLSLEEFTLLWISSGYLHLRGKHAGQYQLCRDGDKGDYTLGNCYIARMEDNLHEAHFGKKKKPAHRRKLAANFAKCRKYVSVSANGTIYSSMTECGLAHGISPQAVDKRLKSNSKSFKDWKVEKVYHGKSNVIQFPSLAKEIDLSEMDMTVDLDYFNDLMEETDYQKLAQGEF